MNKKLLSILLGVACVFLLAAAGMAQPAATPTRNKILAIFRKAMAEQKLTPQEVAILERGAVEGDAGDRLRSIGSLLELAKRKEIPFRRVAATMVKAERAWFPFEAQNVLAEATRTAYGYDDATAHSLRRKSATLVTKPMAAVDAPVSAKEVRDTKSAFRGTNPLAKMAVITNVLTRNKLPESYRRDLRRFIAAEVKSAKGDPKLLWEAVQSMFERRHGSPTK